MLKFAFYANEISNKFKFLKSTSVLTRRAQYGQDGSAPCGYSCANKIVFSQIKDALGLGESKGCFTAAAPISVDTLNYFASLDIPVYEVRAIPYLRCYRFCH